jgi:hypothetical protein
MGRQWERRGSTPSSASPRGYYIRRAASRRAGDGRCGAGAACADLYVKYCDEFGWMLEDDKLAAMRAKNDAELKQLDERCVRRTPPQHTPE